MGADVEQQHFTRADRARHRAKVRACLAALRLMVAEDRFAVDPCTGLEMELNLVDPTGVPALRNEEVLHRLEDPDFVTELGQWNLEINVPPRPIEGGGLRAYEDGMRASLNRAEAHAAELDVHLVTIGILPTLGEEHVAGTTISANPRYRMLNDAVLAERGEDVILDITGAETLRVTSETIMPEAACTSVQAHVQVSPAQFGDYWNAAQTISGAQLAVGANSPFLLGRQLWAESRIPLFQQATDTRSEELRVQGVRPRVWFGEGWCEGVMDLFDENVRYFAGLLPVVEEEDPHQVLAEGGVPGLGELLMHSSTVWRWNRPVYDVSDGEAHLRVENRVLPAGPTVIDTTANVAFFFGLTRGLVDLPRPPWSRMPFAAAEESFNAGARRGIEAELYWPGVGDLPATDLVLRRLLPIAHDGLRAWGVDREVAERYLGVIEGRCTTRTNGASWFVAEVAAAERRGVGRADALRGVLEDYRAAMHSNEPVHTWA
ncbi:glutamate--cysteine ligase [Nocardioidaceae bacterium]|nr:glutamate--cysteine ligase [Nocardioidaceae bacterium]